MPSRLYHYTSIEALAMMLSTRKLKFNRLDLVNDPEEADANDLLISKELVFATCWTAEEEESLPMWRMYTPKKRGIRIGLPWDFIAHTSCVKAPSPHNCMFTLSDYLKVKRDSGASTLTRVVMGPYKIQYDENHKTSCVTQSAEMIQYELSHLGTKKREHWRFEKEWRYKILGVQSAARYLDGDDCAQFVTEMYDSNNHVKTKFLLVPLRKDALQDIQIMIGPSADDAIEILVRALLRRYRIKMNLTYSKIKYNW